AGLLVLSLWGSLSCERGVQRCRYTGITACNRLKILQNQKAAIFYLSHIPSKKQNIYPKKARTPSYLIYQK
ncbi:hypothetical protein, partial [Tenebrionibacter intestinalis]|uniref:hypothetical protein n=1 Tax=Tenebrionibacter intestinalis TaxID=2799638 RepID=UPI001EE95432